MNSIGHSAESAIALIESVKDYRVLFVGDTIIDEYHYVTPLGKAAKENLIPVRYRERERFMGGVDAAAEHVRSLCATVDIASCGPSTRKVRFVEQVYLRKMFEVHYRDGNGGRPWPTEGEYDCVVVTDFGHGEIHKTDTFPTTTHLAVSAQTNSANRGFNLITKYARADYMVIDEPEARLAAADQDGHIEDIIHKLAHGRCERFVVTHGPHGAYGYDHGKFYHQPALSDLVLDTMGAGDAFFAVTAPMSKTGSMEDLLLIGAAAGAIKCSIVGHRQAVTKEALIDFVRARS